MNELINIIRYRKQDAKWIKKQNKFYYFQVSARRLIAFGKKKSVKKKVPGHFKVNKRPF